ncbi:MAG: NIPSNAP family protein, partial [Pseudomonadota bacterium]|nr:NIPSNAP family protein [Pseudomonadota bacterium]
MVRGLTKLESGGNAVNRERFVKRNWRCRMHYDVTIITVRPGTQPKALARLKDALPNSQGNALLACWYSELGALNQVLLLHSADEARMGVREKSLRTDNPFGIGEFVAGMTMDRYVSFDFMEPMKAGEYGPVFEVRTYL